MTGLKRKLQEKGKTPYWLSKQLDVTPNTAYNWAEGRTAPRDNMKVQISKLLNVSIEELFFSDNGGGKS